MMTRCKDEREGWHRITVGRHGGSVDEAGIKEGENEKRQLKVRFLE